MRSFVRALVLLGAILGAAGESPHIPPTSAPPGFTQEHAALPPHPEHTERETKGGPPSEWAQVTHSTSSLQQESLPVMPVNDGRIIRRPFSQDPVGQGTEPVVGPVARNGFAESAPLVLLLVLALMSFRGKPMATMSGSSDAGA